MNKVRVQEILELLDAKNIDYLYKGSRKINLSSSSPINKLEDASLSFCRNTDLSQYSNSIKSNSLIIVRRELSAQTLPKANYLFVDNPSLCFNITAGLFKEEEKFAIHSSAIIDNKAILDENINIGANSVIGPEVQIGKGVRIEENCVLKNTVIGDNVKIQAGVKIGSMGLGSYLHNNGEWFDFPHFRSVIIHDNVVIQDNAVINRGTLTNTIIGKNVRIGPLSWMAHGVIVGESCFISQGVMVAGSVKIGQNSTVWGNASIRDGITIGINCVIGMGSVVTKNIPDNQTWFGVPAREF